MGLTLRDDVFFAPVPEGVYVRRADRVLLLRGQRLDAWLDRLAPHLDGTRSLDELCHGLRAEQREVVASIVQPLVDNGFIRAETPPAEDTASVSSVPACYAPLWRLLSLELDAPHRAFASYRATRTLVVGEPLLITAVLRTGLESGLRHQAYAPLVDPDPDERIDELVAYFGHRDPDLQVERLTCRNGTSVAMSATVDPAGYDIVVAALPADRAADMEALAVRARKAGAAFIAVLTSGTDLLIGPLPVSPETCWPCASARLSLEPAASPTPAPAASIAGALVGFEMFKARSGLPPAEWRTHLALLDTTTFDLTTHAVPACPHHRAPMAGHAPVRPSVKLTALVQAAAHLTDPVTGVLASVNEGDLPQVPVNACAAVVRLRAGRTQTLVDVGPSPLHARARVIIAALERYASTRTDPNGHPDTLRTTALAARGPALRARIALLAAASLANAQPAAVHWQPGTPELSPPAAGEPLGDTAAATLYHARLSGLVLVRSTDPTPLIVAGLTAAAALRRCAELRALAAEPACQADLPTATAALDPDEPVDARTADLAVAALSEIGYQLVIRGLDLPELSALTELGAATATAIGSCRSRGTGVSAPLSSAADDR